MELACWVSMAIFDLFDMETRQFDSDFLSLLKEAGKNRVNFDLMRERVFFTN